MKRKFMKRAVAMLLCTLIVLASFPTDAWATMAEANDTVFVEEETVVETIESEVTDETEVVEVETETETEVETETETETKAPVVEEKVSFFARLMNTLAAEPAKVTYTDGVEGKEVFADVVFDTTVGAKTPAFKYVNSKGQTKTTPTRTSYKFMGWKPEVADTVTGDTVYEAMWIPSKAITDTDVQKMEIGVYGYGSEFLNPYNEPYSISGKVALNGKKYLTYDIGEIKGDEVSGYTQDVTFHFASGDQFEINERNVWNGHSTMTKNDMIGDWRYRFTKEYPADQTITFVWSTSARQWKTPSGGNIVAGVANHVKVYMELPCTVTYTDGVEGKEVFPDVVSETVVGDKTPAFKYVNSKGQTVTKPTRTYYKFVGWKPAVTDKVTGNTVYEAMWTPSKPIDANAVRQMQIRIYAYGSDFLNPNNEPYSINGQVGYSGKDYIDYEIGEVKGDEATGFTQDVTFHFKNGDLLEERERGVWNTHSTMTKNDMTGDWRYRFTEDRPADQTLTFKWNTSTNKWSLPTGNNITAAVSNYLKLYMELPRTVTYTDGVEDVVAFEDQVYDVLAGDTTPAYEGTPERAGYTFTGWDEEAPAHVTKDAVYTAQWTVNTYVVNFDSQGGSEAEAMEVTYDEAVGELPVSEKEGYTFEGWCDEEGNEVTAETIYAVADDSTYTAQWTANTYVVSFDSQGGNEVDAVEVTYDEAVGELPVPEKEGYTFEGWCDEEGNEVTAETIYAVADDSTYTAQWTANTYTVNFDSQGGSEAEAMEVTYDEEVGELPVPEKEGYTFEGWYDEEGNEVTAETIYTVAGDSTYTAQWTEVEKETETETETETPSTGDNQKPDKPTPPAKPNKPNKPGKPQTGDSTPILFTSLLMVAGVFGVAALTVYKKKRTHR